MEPSLNSHQRHAADLKAWERVFWDHPFLRAGLVVVFFSLLALGLTWPLVAHIRTHVPGDGIDDPALAWNLWWVKTSWVDRAGETGLVHNPFRGDSMFHPIGINLAFYTLTLLNAALSIPLQSAWSLILASNLVLLSSFVLSGLGTYLLALQFFRLLPWPGDRSRSGLPHLAALLAGLLYAFASAKLFYAALGQFNIASSQWLPFIALYLLRGLRRTSNPWREGFFLGLFLLFQTWAELTYGTFGVLLIAGVTLAAVGVHLVRRDGAGLKAPLITASVAAGMFILGMVPYLVNMLPDMRVHGDFLVEGRGFADIFSADLVGFFFPTQLHPLFGGIIRQLSDNSALRPDGSQFMVNKGQHIYPGYGVWVLTLIGLWVFRKRWQVWAVAGLTLFFTWAALGPQIRVRGYATGIPGIFAWLIKIPFFQANRYPGRYSVMVFLGLSLLVGLGGWSLLARARTPIRRVGWAGLLAGLILFEHLSIPLPLSDFRLPPAYAAVVADSRQDALLDLPVGWRNGFHVFGKSDVIIMFEQWWQTYHGKPLLGGNTSRNPEQKFQYFLENPVIGVVVALQDGREVPSHDLERARALGPDLLTFLNIHTVMVHRDKVPPDFESHLRRIFPLTLQGVEGDVARYEAQTVPLTRLDMRPGDRGLATYLDDGWAVPARWGRASILWAVRPDAELLLPASDHASTLTLTLYTPGPQSLDLRLDGQDLAHRDLDPGIHTLTFELPPARNGFPRHLLLHAHRSFDPSLIPHQDPALGVQDMTVGATGVQSPFHITVRSAGKDTGDFGHIFVNGVDVSPNQRGYNLVWIDPTTGRVVESAHFDTHDPRQAPQASAAMAAWIQALPAGAMVAGAVRDAAALSLGEDAVQALHTLGVVDDVRGHLRRAHGFVGVKGAAPGTALSQVSDLWPVTVVVGQGFTAATPTLGLMRVQWDVCTTNGSAPIRTKMGTQIPADGTADFHRCSSC